MTRLATPTLVVARTDRSPAAVIRPAFIAVAMAAGVVTTGCTADDGAQPPAERAREVRVSGCPASGVATGIDVGDGLVVTVAHVLRGADAITVDGGPAVAVVLDHRADLAVVTTARRSPVVPIGPGGPGAARLVTAGGSRTVHVDRRVTARIDEPRDDATYTRSALVVDGRVVPGESGSGLFDPAGRLTGVVFAASELAERAYAVAGDEIAAVVDRAAPRRPVDLGDCARDAGRRGASSRPTRRPRRCPQTR